MKARIFIPVLLLIAITACSGAPETSTPASEVNEIRPSSTAVVALNTPAPTNIPASTPTETPLFPTDIPTPAATTAPSATPTPIIEITPTPAIGVGSTHISPKTGMVLVYVPEGEFLRGSADTDIGFDDEKPQRAIYLDAFWIDQTEVTNAMFAAFINAQGNQEEEGVLWLNAESEDVLLEQQGDVWVPKADFENHPVIEVTWYGAQAYCAWAGERLPTEAEWEKAARGPEGQIYPWDADTLTGDLLNAADPNLNDGYAATAPVGSYPAGASPYGALDMAGNVWEWLSDWYGSNYYAQASASNPTGPEQGSLKTARGGSWNDLPEFARPAYRGGFQPSSTFNITGFRCASSSEITPEPTPTPDITNVALRINSSVFSVAWSSDGNLLAAGTIDDNVYIWDAVNQETWRILGPHEYGVRDLAYSPNGQFLASGSFNSGMKSGTIEIWRATSGVQLETLHGFFGAVGGVAWSPDSRYLAGGSSNGNTLVWDVTTWEQIKKLSSSGEIWTTAWSPGGKLLATGGESNSVTLWETSTWGIQQTLQENSSVYDVKFSPDGSILAIATKSGVTLWDVERGEILHTLAHSALVNSVSFSPDGSLIASASADHNIHLWNAAAGELVHTLEGHTSYVFTVAFSPNGRILASGSKDETIILWYVSKLLP